MGVTQAARTALATCFVGAGLRVLQDELGLKVRVGAPALLGADVATMPVNVLLSMVGQVQGLVMYGMEDAAACQLVAVMAGEELSLEHAWGKSALGEMGNLITGLASAALEAAGLGCNISPPAVMFGGGNRILTPVTAVTSIPIETSAGDIQVFLALEQRDG